MHARLVRELPEVSICLRRYVQNQMIFGSAEAAEEFGVGIPSDDFDFDGIMEAYFDSMADMTRMTMSDSYLTFILPDDQHLVDAARCKVYLTEETIVVDVDKRPVAEEQLTARHETHDAR